MEELGFAEHLIMGKSDLQNNVQEELSVQEDLFEAILGAVTLDCNWDLSTISSVVEAMLVPEDFFQEDTETNYVRLIQEWEEKKNGVIPWYWFEEVSYHSQSIHNYMRSQAVGLPVISQPVPMEYSKYKAYFQCELKLLDSLPVFRGVGVSKSEARMNVCKLAYEHLDKHGLLFSIQDEIENPNKADAINQLEILARRGYFPIPTYAFEQSYDKGGNPTWKCECHIAGYDTFFWQSHRQRRMQKRQQLLKCSSMCWMRRSNRCPNGVSTMILGNMNILSEMASASQGANMFIIGTTESTAAKRRKSAAVKRKRNGSGKKIE